MAEVFIGFIFLLITVIFIIDLYHIKKYEYHSYTVVDRFGKISYYRGGQLKLYHNRVVWHGKHDYKVTRIKRDDKTKKIVQVICSDFNKTRVFNIS